MSGAYLPVLPVIRDRANEYLAGMAARGFVPMPTDELVRRLTLAHKQEEDRACPNSTD